MEARAGLRPLPPLLRATMVLAHDSRENPGQHVEPGADGAPSKPGAAVPGTHPSRDGAPRGVERAWRTAQPMHMGGKASMDIAVQSDCGRVRTSNEDYVLVNAELGMLIVADG